MVLIDDWCFLGSLRFSKLWIFASEGRNSLPIGTIQRLLTDRKATNHDRGVLAYTTIGTRQLAKSPPDGYTLVMGSTGTVAMAPSVFPNVGYDPRKDFAPIGLIARSAIVLVVGPAVAARSVRELIEAAQRAHAPAVA